MNFRSAARAPNSDSRSVTSSGAAVNDCRTSNTPRRMERIAEKLAARGHTAARIEKIIGGNFVRLMKDTWLA